MCDNARINDDLSNDNDYSSYCLNSNKYAKIMYSSGDGKPPRLEFEIWNNDHWSIANIYYPKYCPNCGREIKEFNSQRHRPESYKERKEIKMLRVHINFKNGDSFTTRFNGTPEEAANFYQLDRLFNIGITEDNLQPVESLMIEKA